MTEQKYQGYSLRDVMLEGLGDAAKAHMLRLWNVAMAAPPSDRDGAIEALREGLHKLKRAYEGGVKLINEEMRDESMT
jgi:hypothetical protein